MSCGLLFLLALSAASWCGARGGAALPGNVMPLSVDLLLNPDLKRGVFAGTLNMNLRADSTAKRLVLNSANLALDSVSLRTFDGLPVVVQNFVIDPAAETLTINPAQPLQPGSNYALLIIFRGIINNEPIGLFNSYDLGPAGPAGVSTSLRPNGARQLFPSFDEPSFRSSITLSVIHKATQSVFSSMPVFNVTDLQNGTLMTVFRTTPQIPANMLALTLGSGLSSETNSQGWTAVVAPGVSLNSTRAALDLAPRVALIMASHLATPLPPNSQTLVALPALAQQDITAWGLTAASASKIAFNWTTSKAVERQELMALLVKAVAQEHGNGLLAVTSRSGLWMPEMIAAFYENYLAAKVEPSWGSADLMTVDFAQAGLLLDSLSARPIQQAASGNGPDLFGKANDLVYTKGPAIVGMIFNILTEKKYVAKVVEFVRNNLFKSVEPDQLWSALDDGSFPVSLASFAANYTNSSGYPVVSVNRDSDGSVSLSQEVFVAGMDVASASLVRYQRWWIPLNYATSRTKNFISRTWFPPQPSLRLPNLTLAQADWILIDNGINGFFRVNYDDKTWNNLISALGSRSSGIPTPNRAQLLDDAFNLAMAGRLGYKTAFDLARATLPGETEFAVWMAAGNAYESLSSILRGSPVEPLFVGHARDLMFRGYEMVGFYEKPGESFTTKLLRELMAKWATDLGNPNFTGESLKYLASLSSPSGPMNVPADVREQALCSGVAYGPQANWETVYELYRNSSGVDKQRYLLALACTRNASNFDRLLMESIYSTTESDWSTRFSAMASREENAGTLINYLANNAPLLRCRFGQEKVSQYAHQIGGFLTTSDQAKRVADLERVAEINLTDVKDGIESRRLWVLKNTSQLTNYFLLFTSSNLLASTPSPLSQG